MLRCSSPCKAVRVRGCATIGLVGYDRLASPTLQKFAVVVDSVCVLLFLMAPLSLFGMMAVANEMTSRIRT